jgi:hypothetical protein
LSADILNAIGHAEDPQQQMSDAEDITAGLVAMLFFRGNFEAARPLERAVVYATQAQPQSFEPEAPSADGSFLDAI